MGGRMVLCQSASCSGRKLEEVAKRPEAPAARELPWREGVPIAAWWKAALVSVV